MAGGQGKFVWYELLTSDPKAAEAFYSKVFGWRMEPGKPWTPRKRSSRWWGRAGNSRWRFC